MDKFSSILLLLLMLFFGCIQTSEPNLTAENNNSIIQNKPMEEIPDIDSTFFSQNSQKLLPRYDLDFLGVHEEDFFQSNLTIKTNEEHVVFEFSPMLQTYYLTKLYETFFRCGIERNNKFDHTPARIYFQNKEWILLDVFYDVQTKEQSILIGKEINSQYINSFGGCNNNNSIFTLDSSEFIFLNDLNDTNQSICLSEDEIPNCNGFEINCAKSNNLHYEDKLIKFWTREHGCHICMWWALVSAYDEVIDLSQDSNILIEWENTNSQEEVGLKKITILKNSSFYGKLIN